MSRYRIVRDDGQLDSIAGQMFPTYEAAYAVLERYYGDLCCSDEREYYRIEEDSAAADLADGQPDWMQAASDHTPLLIVAWISRLRWVRQSWQHLQLEDLGSLIQATVVAGEKNGLVGVTLQFVASGELHAVVAPQTKHVGKAPSCFYQSLADLNDCEMISAIDQMLTGLFNVVPTDRIVSLSTGHARHGLCPGDPTDRYGFSVQAALRHLIRAGLTDQQLDQGTGVAEKDHQLSPDLPSRFH